VTGTQTPPGGRGQSNHVLDLIGEGVTALAGFGVAAISARRGEQFEVLSVVGPPEAAATLRGQVMPVAALREEIAGARVWGRLRFLPGQEKSDKIDDWVWTPSFEPRSGEDAWHPDDLLVALLRDQDGELRGLLSMDLPVDGRRPSPEQRQMLEHYAVQAERAVVEALAQEEVNERLRLARTARRLVRQATAQPTLADIVDTVTPLLAEGFSAARVALYAFADADGHGASAPTGVGPDLVGAAERWARQSWSAQQTIRVPEDVVGEHPLRAQYDAFLEEHGLASLLVVPLGASSEVVGNLSIGRARGAPTWTEAERETALDIGADLGRAILNARTLDRERRLARDKDELVTTLAHELMTPITAIVGHVELMRDDDEARDDVRRGLDAVARGATRLQVMATDLIHLAATDDPGRPLQPRAVDLGELTEEVLELLGAEAATRGVRLRLEDRPGQPPVLAAGDDRELARVVYNLVGNAVKYSDPGSEVVVRLRSGTEGAELEVADQGLGIAEADRALLFTEFFRSSNPTAAARPGTGLGLTIVRRTVARHGGAVEVDSTLGVGSTFRVMLPSWTPPES